MDYYTRKSRATAQIKATLTSNPEATENSICMAILETYGLGKNFTKGVIQDLHELGY